MKNILKSLAIVLASLAFGVASVSATTAKSSIDASACEEVYTNYYFLLEAETSDYMQNSELNYLTHINRGTYRNNFYSVEFDEDNVGFGQVNISRSTTSSKDGISSMSLKDYYDMYLKAVNSKKGTYTKGNKNYIVVHDFSKYDNGKWIQGGDGLNLKEATTSSMINATIDVNSEITRLTDVTNTSTSTFVLEITRKNYGALTGNPISNAGYDWYLHPAVYYVQYCEADVNVIQYDGNAKDATNVPKDTVFGMGECANISSVVPVRNGYTFLGWSTDKNATVADATYAANAKYCGKDITLYAIWKANAVDVYSIVYLPNTSDVVSNMPGSVIKPVTESATISTDVPVRNGYTFLGWSTQNGATVADGNYRGGALYTDAKDLVLYAVWKKNDVTPTPVPENPKTGVSDYLLPFSGVSISSLVGYMVLKKKNSYKQF